MNIDATIQADTLSICTTRYSHIRLMNDKRWPWLILLPAESDVTELHQLEQAQRTGFLNEVNLCSQIVQSQSHCRSVNIAMLGNVVSALHCHVVARDVDDPNWPGPVWGFEKAIAYVEDDLPDNLLQAIKQAFLP